MSIEALVNKATDENNTSEDWNSILDIADRVKSTDAARSAVSALIARVQHRSSSVVLSSITVADALIKNCGVVLHREIASRAFLDALKTRLADRTLHESARNKILESIQSWANSMKSDPSLGYVQETYRNLMAQGHRFPSSQPPLPSSKPTAPSKPSQSTEDEELQLALALSLSEAEAAKSQPKTTSSAPPPKQAAPSQPTTFKVRALYDFNGDATQGELPLTKGDIVTVTDQTYKDWWKGETRSRAGFFPANYVELLPKEATADPEAERSVLEGVRDVDRFLIMLAKVDPTRENLSENEQLLELHHSIITLRPKLVRLIEYYSKKKEQLLDLNDKFTKAQTSYTRLVDQAVSAQRQAALSEPSSLVGPGPGGASRDPNAPTGSQQGGYYPPSGGQASYYPGAGAPQQYSQGYGGWEQHGGGAQSPAAQYGGYPETQPGTNGYPPAYGQGY
ncbi:hypothetical protein M427DRAFT_64587 [Gonapodya prolifera JEL478]|uniref:Class E vacuolar protein-sorting machinery protein HSE1 n=1 Tax=Gonapodya prolifera (strain JEL478) TaxID=1344416 RepID=A0A138ZXI3_GONPJ|nr:hypothetical protein M427DRAFT_64587 [Gonapodya prolifera JEL478]|eukprot:KXS09207.1 hypothetical protein M427DRAFT_64587 [Gonapodya prolifera JEL478]